MCGIAGIIDTERSPSEADITAMVNTIPYRGPDGHGHVRFEQEGVALGHRRLSILDVSDAGHQPMSTADGRYWVTYNGEIYNFVEIRQELEQHGHRFRSGSDTEVLLYAYQQWGTACLDRFMGMYAFAIWDRHERKLFAARDRLGIKPLYFKRTKHGLIFASEIKSILAVRGERSVVDTPLIDAYMNFGYVPGERTLHKGIERLLPGHMLEWHDNKVSIRSYWELRYATNEEISLTDAASTVREMLQDSIRLHLRSDVPLGVFLSGGLDSSSVVSLLSPGASSGLKTFSVAYDFGPEFDETPYAREVAGRFSTDHHEIRVDPSEFQRFIPTYIDHMDEPVTEAAAISLYFVSKLAREHVTVCLSGEGSDELFAGYDFYTYNLAIERLRSVVGNATSPLATWTSKIGKLAKVTKYLRLASLPLEKRYLGISSYSIDRKAALYTRDFAAGPGRGDEGCAAFLQNLFDQSADWDPLSRMLHFDTKTWLVDDLLIKADRMSMATSIELRVPFLDHRLVEYAASLPSRFKIAGRDTKHVLKKALEGLLPERILRRKKMGFPTPLELMFRGGLFEYAHDLLMSETALARGYFDRSAVQQLLLDHRDGRAKNHREIWQLIVLEEWHRRFAC
jgi:asparagine synthase (glutamine-hydrolysing)